MGLNSITYRLLSKNWSGICQVSKSMFLLTANKSKYWNKAHKKQCWRPTSKQTCGIPPHALFCTQTFHNTISLRGTQPPKNGDMVTLTPHTAERFYLRLLLHNKAEATSFDNLKTIGNYKEHTRKHARGLAYFRWCS